ncbi:MAG: DNRLRE domain-containing protein, partial [Bifidobacteriales bacterium]|nr:DNRLRE domain-containing protein [Bifidobacteriales bacterium]
YNNTFYVGDGVSTSLFGEGNSGDNSGTIAHFTNNILYKTGSGSLKFLAAYPPDGSQPIEHRLHGNPGDFIKHNLIWPDTVPTAASGTTVEELEAAGNVFQAPKLVIDQNSDAAEAIRNQLGTTLSNPETSLPWSDQVDRMRTRASLFRIQADSPAVAAGIRMEGAPDQDMFGGSTKDRGIDIGATQVSNHEIATRYEIPETRVNTFAGVYPALPETLKVTVRESSGGTMTEKVTNMPVTWDQLNLSQFGQAGEFTVAGRIPGIPDQAKASVTVTGQVGSGRNRDVRSLAGQAATVERGSSEAIGAKPGTSSKATGDKYPFGVSYSNNLVLKLKNSSSASYNRRFYVKVDPSAYPGQADQIKKAKLRVFLSRFDINNSAGSTDAERLNNTAFSVDVYKTDPGWDQSTLTWANGPLNAEVTEANHRPLGSGETIPDYAVLRPGAHQVFTNKEIIDNGSAVDIDVTSIVRSMGGSRLTGPVSFLVDIPMSDTPNFNRDNGGFDAFSVEGARQAYADFQSGLLTIPAGVSKPTDEHSLAPQLLVSDAYITSVGAVSVTS